MGCCGCKRKDDNSPGESKIEGSSAETSQTSSSLDSRSKRIDVYNFQTLEKNKDGEHYDENQRSEGGGVSPLTTVTQAGKMRYKVKLDPVARMVNAATDISAIEARKSHKRDEGAGTKDKRRKESVRETLHEIGGHIIDKKTGKRKYVLPKTKYIKLRSMSKSKSNSPSRSISTSRSNSTSRTIVSPSRSTTEIVKIQESTTESDDEEEDDDEEE